MANPIATIEMENGGKIVMELFPDVAPQSVRNFVTLAQSGFYDGLIFHRVISGFMIQGGCPEGTGMGGPGYCIKGEFKLNGVDNNVSHKRGVVSMARAQSPNSGGSQFFIMHADGEFLDGQYAAFGQVIEGMEVVDAIAAVKTDGADRPQEEQKIKSITVDTQGKTYMPPEKLKDIWERYYKVDKEHKRAQMGSGLGLSIVKNILDMHGGTYGVTSTLGQGSTFWFELPVARQSPEGLPGPQG